MIRTAAIFLRLWHFLLAGIAGGWLLTVASGFSYDGLLRPAGQSYLVATGDNTALVDTASKYDRLDRVVEETSGGEKHAYAYDIAGNRTSVTYARTSRNLVTVYDAAGRVSTITDVGGGAGDLVTGYFYDIGGLVLGGPSRTLPFSSGHEKSPWSGADFSILKWYTRRNSNP